MASTEEILSLYPQYEFLLHHPEIGKVLRKAADEGWDGVKLEAALHETKWWKATWPSMRRWEAIDKVDPGGAKNERAQADFELRQMVDRLGIQMNDAEVRYISEFWLRHGKDEWWLLDNLGAWVRKHPRRVDLRKGGELAGRVATMKELAAEYLVPLDDATARQWALDEWTGAKSTEWFQSYFVNQSKKRFTFIEDELDRGMTVREYFTPVVNAVAQELEMAPNQINLMDSKWSQIVSAIDDDGKYRPMTVTEAQRWAREQEEYQFTQGADDKAAALETTLLQRMGVMR